VSSVRAPLKPSAQGRLERGVVRLVSSCLVLGMVVAACGASKPASPRTDGRDESDRASGPLPSPPTLAGQLPSAGLVPRTIPRVEDPTTSTTESPTMLSTDDRCITYTLTNVNFGTNSAGLATEAGLNVDNLAAILIACDCPFTLHGFADVRPTSYPGGNQQLSFDRASTVRTELIARGVPPGLFVDVVGHGTEDPVPGDLAASRRVEIVLACPTR
jgi:outer membrane protein OmpA-like peptidoglycan-associated protein